MDYLLYIIIIVLIAGIFYLFFRQNKKGDVGKELKDELKEIRKELNESRDKNLENLQKQFEESGRISRDANTRIKEITSQLEKIHTDNQHVIDVKNQLGKLTDVLANPKQRGSLGEYFLETLITKCFSAQSIPNAI